MKLIVKFLKFLKVGIIKLCKNFWKFFLIWSMRRCAKPRRYFNTCRKGLISDNNDEWILIRWKTNKLTVELCNQAQRWDPIRNGNVCTDPAMTKRHRCAVHSGVHFSLLNSKPWNVHLVKFFAVKERGICGRGITIDGSASWSYYRIFEASYCGHRVPLPGTRPNTEHDNMH